MITLIEAIMKCKPFHRDTLLKLYGDNIMSDVTLKIKAFGTKGYMVLIGPGNAKSDDDKWYFMSPEIKKQIDGVFLKGDSVVIKSETKNDKHHLTYINKTGSGPAQPAGTTTAKPSTGYVARTPADNESIKRQALGNMTSRVLSGMMTSGICTLEQVEDQMERVYKKFQTLVG